MTSQEFRTNPLFLRDQFRGEGVFGLPVIHKEEMSLANIDLVGYDNLYRGETQKALFLQGYTEMMKRVQPEAILCYGKPFEEMGGRLIEIGYAKMNRLSAENPGAAAKEEKSLGSSHSPILVFKQGHVTSIWEEKGMGSAGNRNALPPNDAQIKHMFRNDEGHLPDTAANRELLLRVANDESCYLGTDENGGKWYAKIQQDGTQVWVRVWGQTIFNGGINPRPRP